MGIRRGPNIVTDGLTFAVDAANPDSYISGSTVWKDQTVNQNNGTLTNDPTFDSNNGGSINFDGVDDYVTCGDIVAFNGVTSFSYSGWYKQDTLDVFNFLFGTYVDTNNNIGIYTHTDGALYLRFRLSGVSLYVKISDYSTVVTAGQWFHLSLVYNGSGVTNADKIKLYIDGSLIALTFLNTFPVTTMTGINDTTLGKLEGFTQEWNGNISNIQIYNKALSSTEVSQNYNALKTRFGL